MASTITAQSLNLFFSETCPLSQQNHTASYQQTITDIAVLDIQTVSAPSASLTQLLKLSVDQAASNSYDSANMKYFSVTNRDGTNYVRLSLSGSSFGYLNYKLEAGQKMFFYNTTVANGASGSSGNPVTGEAAFSWGNWQTVSAVAIGGPVYLQTVYAAINPAG